MFETEKQPETCTNGDPSSSGPAIVVTGLLKKCAERNSPPGVGKTHLSVALAEAAIQAGFGAYFMTAHDLVTDLGRAYREGRLDRRIRVYLAPKVLVIDENGVPASGRSLSHHLLSVGDRALRGGDGGPAGALSPPWRSPGRAERAQYRAVLASSCESAAPASQPEGLATRDEEKWLGK